MWPGCARSPTTSSRTRCRRGTASRSGSTGSCARAPRRAQGIEVADARAATRRGARARAHGRDYLARVAGGELSRRELLALGLPWSPELVERARRSVGATLLARRGGARRRRGRKPRRRHAPRLPATRAAASASSTTSSSRFGGCGAGARCAASSSSTSTCTRATARTLRSWTTRTPSRSRSTASPTTRSAACPGDLELDLPDGTGDDRYLEGAGSTPPAGARPRAARPLLLPRRRGSVRGRPARAPRADEGGPGGTRPGSSARRSPAPACPSASRSRAATPTRSRTPSRSTCHAADYSPSRS